MSSFSYSNSLIKHSNKFGFLKFSSQCVNLDFNYLCDPKNTFDISTNIKRRKSKGNIQIVKQLYKNLQVNNSSITLRDELMQEALKIPNKCHPVTFSLTNEPQVVNENSVEIVFKHKPISFEAISRKLNLVKTDNLTNFTGPRSYYLFDQLAILEQALIKYSMDYLLKLGFQLVYVPDIISRDIIEACGMNTRGERTQVYTLSEKVHGIDLCLSGTAEMGIASMLANKIFSPHELPLRFTAVSRCFRAETSKIAEEKGIYRVHSFTKVEMFGVTSPEESESMLAEFVVIEEKLFSELGLKLRTLEMPPEELGDQAYRKLDVEAWLPGRQRWAELSSASNCTDYQSRRLPLLVSQTYPHTLNGTAAAIPRLIIALIETHQNPDSTVTIPPVLRPYTNFSLITKSRMPHLTPFKRGA